MLTMRHRIKILDTWIDKVDVTESLRRIDGFIRSGKPNQVVTVNLDFLRLSVQDRSFQELINQSSLAVPDGMPLVWGARLLGDPLPDRVPGVDLVVECSRLAAQRGYRIFFLGAGPGVAENTAALLCERFPGLQVVGTHAPPSLDPQNDTVTVELIRAASPDILFVAFGAPRQELWIRQHMHTLSVPVSIGVGGAFDLISGRVNRAPSWMQQGGMEWFYRFLMEPRRLWKRYFLHDLPVFAHLIASCAFVDSGQRAAARVDYLPFDPIAGTADQMAVDDGSVMLAG